MSTHIHVVFRAREIAQEQAGLLPNPKQGKAVDSDAVIDYKFAVAQGGYNQPYFPATPFYFNSSQQTITLP